MKTPESIDWAVVKAELQEKKEKYLADRIELQTQIFKGDLILRTIVTANVSQIFATWRNQVLSLDLTAGDIIANLINSTAHETRKILSELSYEMTREIKKSLEVFITGRP